MASLDKYKLTSVTWDSDKEPTRFTEFMVMMSAMVRAIDHGNHLRVEDFLDAKLGRSTHQHVTTPSFLSEDPEFARPTPAAHSDDTDPEDLSPNAYPMHELDMQPGRVPLERQGRPMPQLCNPLESHIGTCLKAH
eukprot:TRINITY_DN5481_c0_g1_i2.p1 TRINITY_DN5481_c0_g1~~TRINITY_DN5481_c0_g1_i2.p1  ORF type:complete len:135 (+),score=11.48 TRINITY_DN5481_c0_g1_i2:438-842(+)